MAISLKQDILFQATQLQQKFTLAKDTIDKMSPSEQLIAATQFSEDSALLTRLQRTVEATFLRKTGAIPEINEKELLVISEQLSTAAEILDRIDRNNEIAAGYVALAKEVDKIYQSSTTPNAAVVKAFQKEVKNLTSLFPYAINQGNREALASVDQVLQAFLGQAPTQSPVIQHREPLQPMLSEDQRIIPTQNEEYQASLFIDQYKAIKSKFTDDLVQDFELVLAHYTEVRRYALSKTSFVSQKAGVDILEHLETLEGVIGQIIQTQTSKENVQVRQVQSQTAASQALLGLKTALEEAISANEPSDSTELMPYFMKIKEAHNKLGADEKKQLFDTLNKCLVARQVRPVAIGALNRLPLTQFPGSLQQKKEAVDTVIVSNGQKTSAAFIVTKADEMKRRMQEVKNMLPPASTHSNQTTSQTPPVISTNFPPELYLPDGVDLSSLHLVDVVPDSIQQQQEIPIISIHPHIEVLHELQALLFLLRSNANDLQLQEACSSLQVMASKELKSVFKMSDSTPRMISDRPFFHIYFIHKNETPEKLKNDAHYGNKAFAGAYPATNEERRRAVERTIVELGLGNLEEAINFDDGATVIALLNILENVKLDAKDRANSQENAAYNLFSAFYHLHVAARNSNSSLVNPHDPQFKGDFGREAFRKSMNGVDPAIKIVAINQVREALKRVWKVQ
jgi:hypothetical protein